MSVDMPSVCVYYQARLATINTSSCHRLNNEWDIDTDQQPQAPSFTLDGEAGAGDTGRREEGPRGGDAESDCSDEQQETQTMNLATSGLCEWKYANVCINVWRQQRSILKVCRLTVLPLETMHAALLSLFILWILTVVHWGSFLPLQSNS